MSRPTPLSLPRLSSDSSSDDRSTSIDSINLITPHDILPPPASLALVSDTFAAAVGWKGDLPAQWPQARLRAIAHRLFLNGALRQRVREDHINSMVWECLSASLPETDTFQVSAESGEDVADWAAGAGAQDEPGIKWRDTVFQQYLRQLRFAAGELVHRARKRRRDDDVEDDNGPDDSRPSELPTSHPPTGYTLVTRTVSAPEFWPSDGASSASPLPDMRAGLLKPDIIVFGHNVASDRYTSPLTGERKDHPSIAALGLAQAIGYILTGYQTFGSSYGLFWFRTSYVRMAMPSDDLLVIESTARVRAMINNSCGLDGHMHRQTSAWSAPLQIPLAQLLSGLNNKIARAICVNAIWDRHGNLDDEVANGLWKLYLHCVTLILRQPVNCPKFQPTRVWFRMLKEWQDAAASAARSASAAPDRSGEATRGSDRPEAAALLEAGEADARAAWRSVARLRYPSTKAVISRIEKALAEEGSEAGRRGGGDAGSSDDDHADHNQDGNGGGGGGGHHEDDNEDDNGNNSDGGGHSGDGSDGADNAANDEGSVGDPGGENDGGDGRPTDTGSNNLKHTPSANDQLFETLLRQKVARGKDPPPGLRDPNNRSLIHTIEALRLSRPDMRVLLVDIAQFDTLLACADRAVHSEESVSLSHPTGVSSHDRNNITSTRGDATGDGEAEAEGDLQALGPVHPKATDRAINWGSGRVL